MAETDMEDEPQAHNLILIHLCSGKSPAPLMPIFEIEYSKVAYYAKESNFRGKSKMSAVNPAHSRIRTIQRGF